MFGIFEIFKFYPAGRHPCLSH